MACFWDKYSVLCPRFRYLGVESAEKEELKMSEIDTNKVYKKIKEHRGERFAKKLRHEGLLDIPNIEHILELANLEDLDDLTPVIRSIYKTKSVSEYETGKNPIQLLNEAGYDAFVVNTEQQKNSIKKYFRPGEQLCTFNDPYRHIQYYMIHAVKRGADKIKPSSNPQREDEYGTSVISIQIAKGGGFISIKNRYNHTVNNPDSTFGNNPDNIIHGLKNSLQKYFGVNFNASDIPLPEHYISVHDQLVYYNLEDETTYWGPTYYVQHGQITKVQTDRETVMDHMIYNDKDKTIKTPHEGDNTCALFAKVFNGKKIKKTVDKATQKTTLQTPNGDRIVINNKGQITELDLPSVTVIPEYFMTRNDSLESINLPNVKKIGDVFLHGNNSVKSISFPKVKEIGYGFMYHNDVLESISLPKVEIIRKYFLCINDSLKSINLPNVKEIFQGFLQYNEVLEVIYLPTNVKLSCDSLTYNKIYKRLNCKNKTHATIAKMYKTMKDKQTNLLRSKSNENRQKPR